MSGASKGREYNYEAMFLVNQSVAADLNGVITHIRNILDRGHAKLIALRKWDDRRLAFEIEKQKRGIYFLAYFSSDPVNLAHIERDCNLSEQILRVLCLRADHLTLEEMQSADGQRELTTEAALRGAGGETQPAGVGAGENHANSSEAPGRV